MRQSQRVTAASRPAPVPVAGKRAGATVVETPGSHALYVSRPEPVAKLIAQAAAAVSATAAK